MLEDKISTSQQINTLSNTDDNSALILVNHYKTYQTCKRKLFINLKNLKTLTNQI